MGLGIGQIYLTLMIDGVGSAPFSAQTIPPIEAPNISFRDDVIHASRHAYARTRKDVEEAISTRQSEFIMPPKPPKPARLNDFSRSGGERKFGGQGFQGNGNSFGGGQRQDGPRHGNFAPQPLRPQFPPRERTPEPVPRDALQRNALRDALSHAAPNAETRSPIDILREKRMKKGDVASNPARHAPRSTQHIPPVREERAERNSAEEAKKKNGGEVSADVLQKVLRGDAHGR